MKSNISKRCQQLPSMLALALIYLYRRLLSPFLGSNCRFYPTCSCYAQQAIEQYGFLKGTYLSCRRLLKCHPYHSGGFDPLPDNTTLTSENK